MGFNVFPLILWEEVGKEIGKLVRLPAWMDLCLGLRSWTETLVWGYFDLVSTWIFSVELFVFF